MAVFDTGVLFASLDRTDTHHNECAALLSGRNEDLIVPEPVVVEIDWLARSRGIPTATVTFLDSIAQGEGVLCRLSIDDYRRVSQLLVRYRDLGLSFVDATVVAVAERLGEQVIATLDRRHFSVVKPAHCEAFTLVP